MSHLSCGCLICMPDPAPLARNAAAPRLLSSNTLDPAMPPPIVLSMWNGCLTTMLGGKVNRSP